MILPPSIQYALGAVGLLAGGYMAFRTDQMISGMRRLMIKQMRMVRRPAYRRMMRLLGWLLLVTSGLLMLLLTLLMTMRPDA